MGWYSVGKIIFIRSGVTHFCRVLCLICSHLYCAVMDLSWLYEPVVTADVLILCLGEAAFCFRVVTMCIVFSVLVGGRLFFEIDGSNIPCIYI